MTFMKLTFQRKIKTNHNNHIKVLKTPLLLDLLQGNKLFGIFFNIEKATLDLTRKTLAQFGTFETNLQRFILYFGDFFFVQFNFQVQELHFLLLNCPRVRDLLVYKFFFFFGLPFLGLCLLLFAFCRLISVPC